MLVNKQEALNTKSFLMANILRIKFFYHRLFLCFWDWLLLSYPATIMVHLSLARYVRSNTSLASKLAKRHNGILLVSIRHPSASLALATWVNTWQRTWSQRNIKWLFSMSILRLLIISKIKVDWAVFPSWWSTRSVSEQAKIVSVPQQVVDKSDFVILMLPNGKIVRDVCQSNIFPYGWKVYLFVLLLDLLAD